MKIMIEKFRLWKKIMEKKKDSRNIQHFFLISILKYKLKTKMLMARNYIRK